MTVFKSARLQLTAWYLLIIMVVSIFFSIAFYKSSTEEIQRVIHHIEHRQQDFLDQTPPPSLEFHSIVTVQDLEESEQHILFILIVINVVIFIFSGAASYFLAGRTLDPIKIMVDEQNRFITDSSHELRTPLTALRSEMEASLLQDSISEAEVRKLIKSNLEEVQSLQLLSDNLIKLSQFESINGDFDKETISLLEVVNSAQKKVSSMARRKHIIIENEISDCILTGDKNRLIELFVIFLDNAIKYSSKNTTIKIRSQIQDHTVSISIVDQGIGIVKENLGHIFDRFYRTDKSRSKTDASGYGLGLSIAKKIIEAHHGIVTVKSEMGKGTTFTIQLPYNK